MINYENINGYLIQLTLTTNNLQTKTDVFMPFSGFYTHILGINERIEYMYNVSVSIPATFKDLNSEKMFKK